MIINLFDFEVTDNMKVFCNNEELYSQFLLYLKIKHDGDILVVTPTISEANKVFNNLTLYDKNVFLFPEDDYLTKKALAVSPEFLSNRVNLLKSLSKPDKKIIICNLNAFVKQLPDNEEYKKSVIKLNINEQIDRDEVFKTLNKIGYRRESIVTETGEYAVRGFIIDIFPIGYNQPIRLELFDDVIENIKSFDVNTQRSYNKVYKSLEIYPVKDEFNSSSFTNLNKYLNNSLTLYQDFEQLKIVQKNINEQKKYYEDNNLLNFEKIEVQKKLFIDRINNKGSDIFLNGESISEELTSYNKLKDYLLKNKDCVIYSDRKELIDKINNLNIKVIHQNLNKSFKFNGISYISLYDIFNISQKKEYKNSFKYGTKIQNLENLKIGDYVVHKEHGIGKYAGIKTISKNNVNKDYILINYKGNDKLYIPAQNIKTLYKYSSKDGIAPKINKLNSKEWEKTKYKIKNKIKDISKNLIKIYKERNNIKIIPYEEDSPEQAIFENEFPYNETKDQLACTLEIKRDMEQTKPMERLLCGDVGYGKTEVIFRAIFKAIMNNKQVCYLCPTTILAKQQFNSALKRFKSFAINIALLTRHTSISETNKILKDLNDGLIDLVIGTHKLLNPSIKYKNLGFLIIDEEHRFGVEHKEKIKEISKGIHVLSVSATPIPRSLQMSLVGIRDMSLIETPPENRYPVQTYVINYDELLLKEAINKEISRDGQVFVVLNNISKLSEFKQKLMRIIPGIRVVYAHGKMKKSEIDEIMEVFVNHEADILLTTTIIENGIDIPNANTIIVLNSDNFGLSQLYQIRGRVGRSNKIAYAYLMYDKNKVLTETAKKRLEAIKEFTTLGSGYKISMRDLSIRGAGDLLGKEQAGFIDSVGVDMYLELINEELNSIQKNDCEKNVENEIMLDEVETHINDKYTVSDELIIELHTLINGIKDEKSYLEVYNEIIDRYGVMEDKLEYYLKQELLESYLNNLKITIFTNNKYQISLKLSEEIYKNLNIEELFIQGIKISTKFNFKFQNKSIIISLNKLGIELKYIDLLIELLKYITLKVA